MKDVENIIGNINRLKMQMQSLKNQIDLLKEEDVSTKFYSNNLKRLSLQGLDLFVAMEKQVAFLRNQKKFLISKQKSKQRRQHGLPMVR